MIVARLNGGLGNQLFQYAAGFSLATRNGVPLVLDLSAYGPNRVKGDTPREPDILQFQITAKIGARDQIEPIRNPCGSASRIARLMRQKVLKQYFVDWHPEVLKFRDASYLDGYFQSELYFADCIDQIRSQFRLRPNIEDQIRALRELIETLPNPVSLHIRRGDYIAHATARRTHCICGPAYYRNALAEMRRLVGCFTTIVFSDDIGWVRENLQLPDQSIYVSGSALPGGDKAPSGPQELALMASCKHHIISNSTFGWWGAYLNRNAIKIVLAPNTWSRSLLYRHKTIIPPTWRTVDIV